MTVDHQASEIGTLKVATERLKKLLDDKDAGSETFRKRQKGGCDFTGLHLQYLGVEIRILKFGFSLCGSETSYTSHFDVFQNCRS